MVEDTGARGEAPVVERRDAGRAPGNRPFSILVVCVGNICRSPLAERLLRQRLERLGAAGAFVVESAGTRGMSGSAMDGAALAQLQALGGDGSGFTARRLDAQIAGSADLVLTATKDVRAAVLALAPGAMRRTFTLRELAALMGDPARGEGGQEQTVQKSTTAGPADLVRTAARARGRLGTLDLDLPDPIGRSAEVHAEVARMIDEAVERIAAALAATVR